MVHVVDRVLQTQDSFNLCEGFSWLQIELLTPFCDCVYGVKEESLHVQYVPMETSQNGQMTSSSTGVLPLPPTQPPPLTSTSLVTARPNVKAEKEEISRLH
ncbi:hypothetical protein MHYP_G00016410 [Metynnis hypsauchen]